MYPLLAKRVRPLGCSIAYATHARINKNGVAVGLDGGKLWKVEVNHPSQLWEIKEMVGKWTHEADLNYLDQILHQLPRQVAGVSPTQVVLRLGIADHG